MFKVKIKKSSLIVKQTEALATGASKVYHVEFSFDDSWQGLAKSVIFRAGEKSVSVLLEGSSCVIPWEVLTPENVGKELLIGVSGWNDDLVSLPTVWNVLEKIQQGAELGDYGIEPTPGVVSEIYKIAKNAEEKAGMAETHAQSAKEAKDEALEVVNFAYNYALDAERSMEESKEAAEGAEQAKTDAQEAAEEASRSELTARHYRDSCFFDAEQATEEANRAGLAEENAKAYAESASAEAGRAKNEADRAAQAVSGFDARVAEKIEEANTSLDEVTAEKVSEANTALDRVTAEKIAEIEEKASSATGINIVQETGDSEDSVMSQKAVTEELSAISENLSGVNKRDIPEYDNGNITLKIPNWVRGGLNGYGEIVANGRRIVSDMIEIYQGYKWEISAPEGYSIAVAFYDTDGNTKGVDVPYEGYYFFFDAIKECKYVRIELREVTDTAIVDLSIGEQVTFTARTKSSGVSEIVKEIVTHGKNLYNPAKNYFSNRANGTGNASLKLLNSEWIELEPNSKYRLTYWADNGASAVICYTLIDGEGNQTTATNISVNSKLLPLELTTGEGVHLFRFGPASINGIMDRMMLEKVKSPVMPIAFEPYRETIDFAKLLPTSLQNPWIGKKMVVDGDSITHSVGREKWQFQAADALGMWLDTTVDAETIPGSGWRGEGGSTIAVEANDAKFDIVSRWQNYPEDADIVLIAGGTNDWAHQKIHLGDFDSTDNTTFNGALNELLPALKNKYPTVPVVMMTPIRRYAYGYTNSLGYKLEDFVNALIAKCRQYNVYCLDMWATCPIDANVPSMYERLFNEGDTTHPNEEGQKVMGRTVAGFIRTLS